MSRTRKNFPGRKMLRKAIADGSTVDFSRCKITRNGKTVVERDPACADYAAGDSTLRESRYNAPRS